MRWNPPEDSRESGDAVNATDESAPAEDQKVSFRGRRRQTIVDGPYTESKELFGGQWPPASTRR
jgi:hypothetical protein